MTLMHVRSIRHPEGVEVYQSEPDAYLLEALTVLTHHLESGVVVLDASGHVVLVNEPAQRLLGLRSTDPRPWSEQVAGYQVRVAAGGRFVALAERPLARALAGETVSGWDGLVRPPGGLQDISLVASAVPLRDAAGRVTGAVGIVSETSRERRLELDLNACEHERTRLLARVAILERQLADTGERAARVGGSGEVSLSPRERAVLELIGRGRTNREIGAELGVGLRTVKTHVEHLFRKLGVTHRTQAAMWAEERRP
jgi:DNA-binding CsgD family transcriptional regulator